MKWVKLACVFAVVLMFTGASEWEGAAGIALDGELPETGYYAATNSFPRNTVVDITNLENGKNIRVIVAAGIENPGFLAVLSGRVANLLGLRNDSVGRIRMIQPSDTIAFSRFTDGKGEDYDILPPEPAPFIGAKDPNPSVVDLPGGYEEPSEIYDYTLVPVEERPPEDFFNGIAEEDIIPSIDHSAWESEYSTAAADYSSYASIPVITSLEQGKYYVQIGAFSKRELIDSAVSRIGVNYPLALQNAGNSDKPLYRILLGPLNLGESGAMLQRVKSIGYKDAFIRQNP